MIDAWLEIVVRQGMLYSLPVLVSLTVAGWMESRRRSAPHPFHAVAWWGAWLPPLLGIAFQRGVIFALPQPREPGVNAAARRMAAHALLLALGWTLYRISLAHPPSAGLPPLHHWWAKVLMFFNLCMLGLHLLPLPGMLVGEWLARRGFAAPFVAWLDERRQRLVFALLAALPLLDRTLGGWLIYPVYEQLATWATA
ncbi:MAG: hypothetical protein R8K47_03405 [Mariprofundaceae bacterium]